MGLTRKIYFCLAIAFGSAPGWAGVSPVAAVRFSQDNHWVAVAGGETVRIVSPERNEPEFELSSKLAQVMDAAWSPDSKTLAVGGGNAGRSGGIELWNPGERRLVHTENLFRDLVYAVAFAPDGKRLVAAGAEGLIRIVDPAGGQTLGTLTGHSGPVLCVAWSSDGNWIASGSADRSIRIWEASSGKLVRSLNNHAGAVQAVVFAPDGQTLFSASSDATIRVWVHGIGRMKRIFRGFGQPVLGLAHVPARQLLLAGLADGSARLLNSETGEQVKSFPSEPAARIPWLHTVSTSPDARWMAWADTAGRYRVVRFPE
jgi:WD40 repeat protein